MCPICGDEFEVLTNADQEGPSHWYACDDDDAQCFACGCTGSVAIDEIDGASIDCAWDSDEYGYFLERFDRLRAAEDGNNE